MHVTLNFFYFFVFGIIIFVIFFLNYIFKMSLKFVKIVLELTDVDLLEIYEKVLKNSCCTRLFVYLLLNIIRANKFRVPVEILF